VETPYLLYVVAKLIGYALWCGVGLWLVRRRVMVFKACGLGLVRLLIGIAFGAMVFIVYHPDGRDHLLLPYLAIYAPIRWLEWSLLAKLIAPRDRLLWAQDMRINGWRFMGIIVSFAIDFLSPEGMAGMFCIGRCLC
jgi:hypothetical protein